MRIFGFTFPWLLVVFLAFFIGAKNPGWLASIPGVNKL